MSFTAKAIFTWSEDPQKGMPFSAFDEYQQLIYEQFMAGNIDVDSTKSDDGLTITRLVKDVAAGEVWRDAILAHRTKYNSSHPTCSIKLI